MQIQAPHRVRHSRRLFWQASPAEVFPLLCPVRETEWVSGWMPETVYSHSGIAEQDCVFVMPGDPVPETWLVTEYQPCELIAFVKLVPDRMLVQIRIVLAPDRGGCDAELTYQYTALSPAGCREIDGYDAAWYEAFTEDWTVAIHRHLRRGR